MSKQIKSAADYLQQAIDTINQRAASRDTNTERSMQRCVDSFNSMTGHNLSVVEGWMFMEFLKMSRSISGSYNEDDYIDGVAYSALKAEAANEIYK